MRHAGPIAALRGLANGVRDGGPYLTLHTAPITMSVCPLGASVSLRPPPPSYKTCCGGRRRGTHRQAQEEGRKGGVFFFDSLILLLLLPL